MEETSELSFIPTPMIDEIYPRKENFEVLENDLEGAR